MTKFTKILCHENLELYGIHPYEIYATVGYSPSPSETTPLLGRGGTGRGDDRDGCCGGDRVCEACTKRICQVFFGLFYLLNCLTGQFIVRPKFGKDSYKCCIFIASTLFLVVFAIVNLVSFVFDVIAWCPFRDCSYIYTDANNTNGTNPTNNTNGSLWYNLTNYTANTTAFGAPSAESQIQYDDWQKVVFTMHCNSFRSTFLLPDGDPGIVSVVWCMQSLL